MKTPCQTGNADDWFIDKKGLLDEEEVLVTLEDAEVEWTRRNPDADDLPEPTELGKVFSELLADAVRVRQRTRRDAKSACYFDCPVRGACLDQALLMRPNHGTWGGYFEEELKKLYVAIDKREKKGAGV